MDVAVVERGLARWESIGPSSVAWKINREVVLLLGWAPAILMQFAHPLVAAGVAEHSDFASDGRARLARLRSTLGAMLRLTFGTPDEVLAAARGINAIHDRVNGRLREPAGAFPAGTPYSARDPELLRWVQATLLAVLPRAYELYVGPLTRAEKEQYCREATGMGPLLGAPEGFFPDSLAALHGYMDAMVASGRIVVTPTARALAREVLYPPLPWLAGPGLWLAGLPAVGLLPAPIRRAYGFAWGPRHALLMRLSAAATRRALRRAPTALRDWPAARAAL
ncbi:MAG TPA: oxygenase MpaB family protein, partial [Chloroflexota bacterium]